MLLPTEADLRSSLSTSDRQKELEKEREEQAKRRREEAEKKLDIYKRLGNSVDELTDLDTDQLESTPQMADAGFMVPAQFRTTELAIQELTRYQQASQLDLLRMRIASDASRTPSPEREPVQALVAPNVLEAERRFMVGKAAFTPLPAGATHFRLKSTAERSLSPSTLQILKERGLDASVHPLDWIVAKLRSEMTTLSDELDGLLGRPVKRTFKRVGNTMAMISTPMATLWNSLVTSKNLVIPAAVFGAEESIPQSHGSVAPAGVADLLVVKQQLVRYEGTDVAHIENVLKGEKKEREHTRRRETEELTFRETELTTSEERELESTSRFEMSRETSTTIKEDASLKAGLTVSGKYGPVVEFSASAEGSVSRSKEEATKSAATFSQDVTDRSATKVTERVLERSSLRVTNEVIEKNNHVLDNTAGAGHIAGVYQWVNKVYQAQMFNYGTRMMYDFMVAEPAAFLISAMENAHANAVEIEKPLAFDLRPDQITEWNYHDWVKRYGATDVQAPPEMYRTKSLDFKAGGGDSHADYNHSGQIAIDAGYKAVFGAMSLVGNVWEGNASVDAVVGKRTHRFGAGVGYSTGACQRV